MVGGFEHLTLAGCGHHQIVFCVDATAGQSFQLHAQRRIIGWQAGGIDQHHTFARQRRQGLSQRLARVDQGDRHVKNTTQGFDLLLRADAVAVEADQGDMLCAVLQHVASGQLG